jgi:ComF family protein
MLAFKYRGKDYLAKPLADLWWSRHGDSMGDGPDVVIAVPSGPWTEFRRGYNQSALLAEALARRFARPVYARALRKRPAPSQTTLSRDRRFSNARKSFDLRRAETLKGRIVLLVDDTCTTGATLSACAALLRRAGVREVHGAAIARESMNAP